MPAPTAERLKIRCYRCNQLLAVVPSKAGSVVSCPKCKADLLIPRPDGSSSAAGSSDSEVTSLRSGTYQALTPASETPPPTRPVSEPRDPGSQSFLDEIAAIIPPEVASLRPEDLRVEAEVFGAIVREPSPTPALASAPATASPQPAAEVPRSPFEDDSFHLPADFQVPDVSASPSVRDEEPEDLATSSFTTEQPEVAAPGSVEVPPPLPAIAAPSRPAEAAAVVPPIAIEPAPIRPTAVAEARSIREVALPVSVVLAWMLFVLASIPMAFLAGLMIGHFLWKAGP